MFHVVCSMYIRPLTGGGGAYRTQMDRHMKAHSESAYLAIFLLTHCMIYLDCDQGQMSRTQSIGFMESNERCAMGRVMGMSVI